MDYSKLLRIFSDKLTEANEIYINEKLSQLGFDKTRRGKVVSVNETNCVVEIDGENYSCKLRRGIYVEPNDIVFVKFPQDSNVDKYVDAILGGNETPEHVVIPAEEILGKLKTVDGHGSGLDADMLDGKHGDKYITKDEFQQLFHYVHSQIEPAKTWIVTHDLNKYPSISVVDSGGSVVVGEVEYIDKNQVQLQFVTEFSGKAYLN